MKSITIDEAIAAISRLGKHLNTTEPIGPLDDAESVAKLECSILQPFVSFAGYYPYRYLYHRAAVLFYFVIKDHNFENGNKRSAVILTMVLLVKNGKMPNFTSETLYDIACEVAESDASDKDLTIEVLKRTFKDYIVPLPAEW